MLLQKCYHFCFLNAYLEFTSCISFLTLFCWSWPILEGFSALLVRHSSLCSFSSISSSIFSTFSAFTALRISLFLASCVIWCPISNSICFYNRRSWKFQTWIISPNSHTHLLDFLLNPGDQSWDIIPSWAEWGETPSHMAWCWREWNVGTQIWIIFRSYERNSQT